MSAANLSSTRKHLRIVAIESSPFLIPIRTSIGLNSYRGFLIDMLKELSSSLNFTFDIYLVQDGKFGVPNANGNWSGLVGELVGRKADFSLAPLSITSERKKVIDFTIPFMSTGLAIMYKRPKLPGAKVPFTGLVDLVTSSEDIQFGMLHGGATNRFFLNSKFYLYRQMGEIMRNRPGGISHDLQSSVERVRRGNFAFIAESAVVDFLISQPPCDLMKVGEDLNTLGYGLGFPKDSDLLELINLRLLELIEAGFLHKLKGKWWKSACPQPQFCVCSSDDSFVSTTTYKPTVSSAIDGHHQNKSIENYRKGTGPGGFHLKSQADLNSLSNFLPVFCLFLMLR